VEDDVGSYWMTLRKEMGRACSMYGGRDRSVQGFGGET
jgi:hypothetical protein